MPKIETVVVVPVYNDWNSVSTLIQEGCSDVHFLLVDDGSTELPTEKMLRTIDKVNVSVLTLIRNIGHQRAIAVGLCYAFEHFTANQFAVMDGDGEDKISSLESLISKSKETPDRIIFGSRANRNETYQFKIGYFVYKKLFKLLSGHQIEFGHFCVIPSSILERVVHVSEIWNHFPAGIIKSKLPFEELPLDRGLRIDGESKMNTHSLVMHGLSAISVFNEVIGIRMIILVFMCFLGVGGALIGTIGMRIFTDYNIPGWSSIIGVALIIILIQLASLTLGFIFQILGTRLSKNFIPILDYKGFVYQWSQFKEESPTIPSELARDL